MVAKLDGLDVREDANLLTNFEIFIDPAVLPELSEEEFYWRELFGMQVVTTQGYDLGQVTDMLETGSNDVLVVKANLKDAFGQKERLIPFLEEQVIKKLIAKLNGSKLTGILDSNSKTEGKEQCGLA